MLRAAALANADQAISAPCARGLELARVARGGAAEPGGPVGAHGGHHQRWSRRLGWLARAVQQVEDGDRAAVRPADGLLVADVDLAEAEMREGAPPLPGVGADLLLALELRRAAARSGSPRR